jgi:regulator of protease activity HflC (stomatin/prohibitin superfamily)
LQEKALVWIGSVVIATIICGAAFLVGRAIRAESQPKTPEADRGLLIMGAAVLVWVVWVGIHTGTAATRQVEAGHVALVYQFGSIVGQRGEGLQFIAPWQNTRTESIQVQRHRFENVQAFSEETQDVFVVATLNYSVSPGAVQELYRSVGPNWFDRLVEPRVQDFFKQEVVQYQTVDVAPNREIIRTNVRDRLEQDLNQFSITVNDLLLDEIDFQQDFKIAIEQKQIATQDALREEERIRQARAEADQRIERERGEAEAVRIAAEAQADANRLIAESLTEQVIQFQAVQRLAGNIQIALIPSGQGVILDPTTLLGSAPQQPTSPPPAQGSPATGGN